MKKVISIICITLLVALYSCDERDDLRSDIDNLKERVANLTIENNTFINLETNTGGYVNIGNLAKTSIKNNIFWTNTDGTGNVVIIRPQITSPTGDICADNLLYKTMTYNWQMFYGGKLPFEGAEELKALTSNPFDGGTFDLANGIFVPNAEYAEYGATN